MSEKIKTAASLVTGAIGWVALTGFERARDLLGHPEAGSKVVLKQGGSTEIALGDGHSLNFINSSPKSIAIFPGAVKQVLGDSCPMQPIPEVDIKFTGATALVKDEELFGPDNLDKGAYGITITDVEGNQVVGKAIKIASGGFDQLKIVNNRFYRLDLSNKGGADLTTSALVDENGTLVHELEGHDCQGLGETGAYALQSQYIMDSNLPILIEPDALKPGYLYGDAIGLGLALLVLTQLALKRTIPSKKSRKRH